MTVWFNTTINHFNANSAIKANSTSDRGYLEDTFSTLTNAVQYANRRRHYFPERVPDVSGNALGSEFKAWLDAQVMLNRFIYPPTAEMRGPVPAAAPPAVVVVHPAVIVPPPPPPAVDEALLAHIALERERTEEARRQTLIEQVLAERDRAKREADRAQRELYEAQQDHLFQLRRMQEAEQRRAQEREEAERRRRQEEMEQIRVQHQHFVQNNLYVAQPHGRGAPPPRIRRPAPPSLAERLSLGMARAVQLAGRVLFNNGNAGLNQRQRLLLDKHGLGGPRRR